MNGWMGGCLDMSTETWLRCRTSCDVARLPLIAAIDHLWQNSTLLFGAIALCTTKIDNSRRPPKKYRQSPKSRNLKNEEDPPPLKLTPK